MNFKAASILLGLGALSLVGCSDGIDGVTTVVNVPVEQNSDGFPDGVWTIDSSTSGIFNESVLVISNNGREVALHAYANDVARSTFAVDGVAYDDFFIDQCFMPALSGTVNSAGILSTGLVELTARTGTTANRIEYSGSVDEDGLLVVEFFNFDNVSNDLVSRLEASYEGSVGSVEGISAYTPSCDIASVGMFEVSSPLVAELEAPLYVDLRIDGSIIAYRPGTFDFNTTCTQVSTDGGWANILPEVELLVDLGQIRYEFLEDGIILAPQITPLTMTGVSLLDGSQTIWTRIPRSTTTGALTSADVENIRVCSTSDVVEIDVLMLPPQQFSTATITSTSDDFSDIMYELIINGVIVSSSEDTVFDLVDSTAGEIDIANAGTVLGVMLDQTSSYTIEIRVTSNYSTLTLQDLTDDNIFNPTPEPALLPVVLASRTLDTSSGGTTPFSPLPSNVEITPGTSVFVFNGTTYVITTTDVFNVVDGTGYDVSSSTTFDPDLDGLMNHEEMEQGTNPFSINDGNVSDL
jgi:hypothetical protein